MKRELACLFDSFFPVLWFFLFLFCDRISLGFEFGRKVLFCVPVMEPRVGNKFRQGRKIGSGSFEEIYLGTNAQTNEEIAI